MAEKMICASCGAQVDSDMPRCPYCDTLIIPGAQKEYMGKLRQVREDMANLDELPKEAVKTEVHRQGRRVWKIMVIVGVLALLLAGLFAWEESKYRRDTKADYIWEQQNFPIMNELYESGKYDELMEKIMAAWDEDRSIWNWKYYDEFFEWVDAQAESGN